MFLGTYDRKIDDKGRLVLPTSFRDKLGDRVVCTIGIESCVLVFPFDLWTLFIARFDSLSFSKEKSRNFKRIFFSMADEVSPDKAGRIALSSPLQDYASLSDDVSVIGVDDHIEIWNKAKWIDQRSSLIDSVGDIIEEVMD